jgi:hypothetical protein
MAKEKLNIKFDEMETFRSMAENANVQIVNETPLGNEVICTVRFRSPGLLFQLGQYFRSAILNNVKPVSVKTNGKNKKVVA